MSMWNNNLFVKDLSTLIELIGDHKLPIEVPKLSTLLGQLKSTTVHKVEISDLAVHISKKISKTKPAGVSRMVIYFSHKCECDAAKDYKLNDPFKTYYFFYQINGYGTVKDKTYINCWRLDQDIVSATSKYTHPYYHFQAGGAELQYTDTGDLILLSAPRLPHPPMDLFLGLHFILNNYLSTKDYPEVKGLFADIRYEQIIKRAQKRMWEYYFKSFDTSTCTHLDYTFSNVFPLYLH